MILEVKYQINNICLYYIYAREGVFVTDFFTKNKNRQFIQCFAAIYYKTLHHYNILEISTFLNSTRKKTGFISTLKPGVFYHPLFSPGSKALLPPMSFLHSPPHMCLETHSSFPAKILLPFYPVWSLHHLERK